MHNKDAGGSYASDNVRRECCDKRGRSGQQQRRGGVSAGQGEGPGTMQDRQLERWCSNSEILCRMFTAYLTVWLGWALPQVSSTRSLEPLPLLDALFIYSIYFRDSAWPVSLCEGVEGYGRVRISGDSWRRVEF